MDAWPPILPLDSPEPAMPYPVDALLLPVLRSMVTGTSDAYGTPPDFAAAGVIGAVSIAAIGNRCRLHIMGELHRHSLYLGRHHRQERSRQDLAGEAHHRAAALETREADRRVSGGRAALRKGSWRSTRPRRRTSAGRSPNSRGSFERW